jgi:hypothetical protein
MKNRLISGLASIMFILNQGCVSGGSSKIQEVYDLSHKEKTKVADFSTGAYHVFEVNNYSFSEIQESDDDYVIDISFSEKGKKYGLNLKSKDKEKLQKILDLEGNKIVLGVDFYPELQEGYNWIVYCNREIIRNASSPDTEMGGRFLFGSYLATQR